MLFVLLISDSVLMLFGMMADGVHCCRWVTSGSTLAPEDPCFFCDTCFRALHYDNAGRKIVPDMHAYPYPDIRHLKQ